jgi:hypothetical protein
MSERRAIVLGFAAASAVPALIFAALPSAPGTHPGLSEALSRVATLFPFFLLYSAAFTLVLGVPAFLLCRRFGLVTWWVALLVGALAGVLISVVVRSSNQPYTDLFVSFVPASTISALTFWLVWRLARRPTVSPEA